MTEYRIPYSTAGLWLGLGLLCAPIALIQLCVTHEPRVLQAALIMMILASTLTWRGVFALSGGDAVQLSSDTIEGSSRRFGPFACGRRSKLLLKDVVHVRAVGWSVWRAEGSDGTNICWTEAHENSESLRSILNSCLQD